MSMVQEGKLDPALVVTHRLPLEEAARAYKIFNDKVLRGWCCLARVRCPQPLLCPPACAGGQLRQGGAQAGRRGQRARR